MIRVYDKNLVLKYCITSKNMVTNLLTYSLSTRSVFEGTGIIVEDTVFQQNGTRYNLAPVGVMHKES
jgi:hypothetical protein